MSTSILRTADAWWVRTSASAAKIDTQARTTKWKLFFARQQRNPKYLQDGDVIDATVATDDGAIDLGTQRTIVRYAR